MKHRPLVLVDIETTGGSPASSRITEIGALRVEDGQVVDTFKQLVNPESYIPPFITNLTGITNEMTWEAPTFREIAERLEIFMDGGIFVAHHVNFDYSFIKMEYERIGNQFAMDRFCSAHLSRALYPEYRSHALDRIIERLGVEVAERHRAFDDAEVIWKFIARELERDEAQLFRTAEKLLVKSRPLST